MYLPIIIIRYINFILISYGFRLSHLLNTDRKSHVFLEYNSSLWVIIVINYHIFHQFDLYPFDCEEISVYIYCKILFKFCFKDLWS